MIKYSDWHNCYDLPWKGLLYEDKESGESAFSHPAKMARGLVFRIVEYALQNGFVQPGSTVVDCFGGVGTTGLPCLMNGLNYIGVELEPAFVSLAQKNIALWNAKFSSMPKWTGQARIIQGDSRHLAEIIGAAGCVVSSPPYTTGDTASAQSITKRNDKSAEWIKQNCGSAANQGYGSSNGQLANLPPGDISAIIASPSWAGNSGGQGEASRNAIDASLFDRHQGGMKKGTGDNPANLDHLPQGSVAAVIGSPPYIEPPGGGKGPINGWKTGGMGGNGPAKAGYAAQSNVEYGSTSGQLGAMVVGSPPFTGSIGSDDPAKRGGILTSDPRRANDTNLTGSYGQSDGQLGAMVVGSPPYEGSLPADDRKTRGNLYNGLDATGNLRGGKFGEVTYGNSDNQLGNTTGETFWSASLEIMRQCNLILPMGGYAIWVTKRYVKAGKIVDFSQQWAALCEACGFEVVEWVHALLTKNGGAGQMGIDGEVTDKSTKRASFFRRLHERKRPDLAIDWEDVIITRKRQGLG